MLLLFESSVARYCERNKQAGLWKQAKTSDFSVGGKKKKKEIITPCIHTDITLNPEMYCIVSLYLLLFLYVMILFCFSSRTSKQYDMQYNRKRNTLTTSPKTRNPRLPIFISDFTEITARVAYNKQTWQLYLRGFHVRSSMWWWDSTCVNRKLTKVTVSEYSALRWL